MMKKRFGLLLVALVASSAAYSKIAFVFEKGLVEQSSALNSFAKSLENMYADYQQFSTEIQKKDATNRQIAQLSGDTATLEKQTLELKHQVEKKEAEIKSEQLKVQKTSEALIEKACKAVLDTSKELEAVERVTMDRKLYVKAGADHTAQVAKKLDEIHTAEKATALAEVEKAKATQTA